MLPENYHNEAVRVKWSSAEYDRRSQSVTVQGIARKSREKQGSGNDFIDIFGQTCEHIARDVEGRMVVMKRVERKHARIRL